MLHEGFEQKLYSQDLNPLESGVVDLSEKEISRHEILLKELEPLIEYVKENKDTRLQLELGGNYLKVVELKGESTWKALGNIYTDIFYFNRTERIFFNAYFFLRGLRMLLDEEKKLLPEDNGQKIISFDRDKQIYRLMEESKKFKNNLRDSELGRIIRAQFRNHEIFGKLEERYHGSTITRGYRLKENISIKITERAMSPSS